MDNGILCSLQPARWGGGELSLAEFIDASIEIARVSPSADRNATRRRTDRR
jgi:hypothetical protein